MIKDNLQEIEKNIQKNKDNLQSEVRLVVVTKTRSFEETDEVLNLGYNDFGENKVKEILRKYDRYIGKVNWHMIGHLQRNKVKQIIDKVVLIHSVDSIALIEEIDKQAGKLGIKSDILLEINIGKEENKYGFSEDEIYDALEFASRAENINVKGLMCMAPFTQNSEIIEELFTKMRKIYDKCSIMYNKYNNISIEILSMGMSNDYEIALRCGSNMLRIGSNIFKGEK